MPVRPARVDLWLADLGSPGWCDIGPGPLGSGANESAAGRILAQAVLGDRPNPPPANLSHSGRLLILGVARDARIELLGVDVEVRRPVPRPSAFARRILGVGERLPDGDDVVAAWTVKEAALKAIGVGLHGDPRDWRFGWGPDGQVKLLFPAEAWGPAEVWAFNRREITIPESASIAVGARLRAPGMLEVRLRKASKVPERRAIRRGREDAG